MTARHTCRCSCTAYGGRCDCWFDGSTAGKIWKARSEQLETKLAEAEARNKLLAGVRGEK